MNRLAQLVAVTVLSSPLVLAQSAVWGQCGTCMRLANVSWLIPLKVAKAGQVTNLDHYMLFEWLTLETGPTTCVTGSTCVFSNPWYSQCLPVCLFLFYGGIYWNFETQSASVPPTNPPTTNPPTTTITTTTASTSGGATPTSTGVVGQPTGPGLHKTAKAAGLLYFGSATDNPGKKSCFLIKLKAHSYTTQSSVTRHISKSLTTIMNLARSHRGTAWNGSVI